MKKNFSWRDALSFTLLGAAGASALAAIWSPVGAWWQWVITAVVLLLAAAGTGGSASKATPYDRGIDLPGLTTVTNTSSRPEQIVRHDRPPYGRKKDR